MNVGDLTTLENAKQWLGLSGLLISAVSNTSPAVVTLTTQPTTTALVSGLPYSIAGATGMAGLDGDWTITVLTPTTFSIPFDATLAGTYTGGAFVGVADPLVARLISATSAFIQNWLGRVIASNSYTQAFDGQGMCTMLLSQYPVTAISALTVNGQTIAARPALTFPAVYSDGGGYTFTESGRLALSGYEFPRGYQNVTVSWTAGFLIADEAQTIPASALYELATLARWSAGDRGVTFTDGTALVAVSGAPAAGEYSVSGSVYTFAAADAGLAVLISYAYVPYDVEQACIDTMGDWFKYRERIGVTSKSIDGQSISLTNFTNTGLPVRARDALQQYKRVAPGVS